MRQLGDEHRQKSHRAIGVMLLKVATAASTAAVIAEFAGLKSVYRYSSALAFTAVVFSMVYLVGRLEEWDLPPY